MGEKSAHEGQQTDLAGFGQVSRTASRIASWGVAEMVCGIECGPHRISENMPTSWEKMVCGPRIASLCRT